MPLGHLFEVVKHILCQSGVAVFPPVCRRIFVGQGNGGRGDVYAHHLFGAALQGIEGKSPRVGKGIQHGFAR